MSDATWNISWMSNSLVLSFLDDELTAVDSVLFDMLLTQGVVIYDLPDEHVREMQQRLRQIVTDLVNQGQIDQMGGQIARRQNLVRSYVGPRHGKFKAEYHGAGIHPMMPSCLNRWLIRVQSTRWNDASVLDLTQQASLQGHFYLWRVDFVRVRIDVYDLPPSIQHRDRELYLDDVRRLLQEASDKFSAWCTERGVTHFIRSEQTVEVVMD